jgi:predicted nucleic acid-binding protein
MPFEVLNAVKLSRKDVEAEALEAVAESLSLYGVKLYSLEGEYGEEVARLAIREAITVHDASYLALAKILNSSLYTADEKLVEEAGEEYRNLIKHIQNYGKE